MYCSKCGAQMADNASFCSACGQPTSVAGGVPASAPPAPTAMPAASPVLYAGFWLRFVAYIIDGVILGFALVMFVFMPMMGSVFRDADWSSMREIMEAMGPRLYLFRLLSLAVAWLYFALLESSAWQATLGKKALGLEVTDLAGRRITFGRATGRYFGKIVSAIILLIGFIMAGFTEKKQALHDMMAGCLVIRKA